MSEKIAIPSAGKMLNPHFGRSEGFDVFEIAANQVQEIEPISMRGFEHQHQGIAQLLKSKGVSKVICGGIGGGMIAGLESVGITVISGASGQTNEVAQAYANGTLVATGGSCGEHEHHHHHGHH